MQQNCFIGRTYRSTAGRSLYLSQESIEMTRSSKSTDIYLAGESGDDIRWKENIAIPMIKYLLNNFFFLLLTFIIL